MGIGKSREWYGQQQEKPSSTTGYGTTGVKKRRRGFFQRRRLFSTTVPITPTNTPSCPYGRSYGSQPAFTPMAVYSPMQSPYLPVPYNANSAPSYIPPRPMMMLPPQRVAPYMAPMSSPYAQPAPMQPVYNNMQPPGPMPGAAAFYPPSYPPAPARFITDWTGGGKISPGFLGPPI